MLHDPDEVDLLRIGLTVRGHDEVSRELHVCARCMFRAERTGMLAAAL
jgi:hypothetical protein